MTTVKDNNSPYLTLVEQGSAPATPGAGKQKLFIDSADGLPKLIDEADVVTPVGIASGSLVQRVISESGASSTGTTLIPLDDTIPQNTEGDQYLSVAITPMDASNILYIDVTFFGVHSVAAWIIAALFQDSVANALAAMAAYSTTAGGGSPINFRHKMVAGSVSTITFKVRAGGHTAGTITFNGNAGTRIFGGVMASSITITELTP